MWPWDISAGSVRILFSHYCTQAKTIQENHVHTGHCKINSEGCIHESINMLSCWCQLTFSSTCEQQWMGTITMPPSHSWISGPGGVLWCSGTVLCSWAASTVFIVINKAFKRIFCCACSSCEEDITAHPPYRSSSVKQVQPYPALERNL